MFFSNSYFLFWGCIPIRVGVWTPWAFKPGLYQGGEIFNARRPRPTQKLFSDPQGFLSKTGPSPKDVYKRRWCTLEGRKLMYHVDMLCAYAKVQINTTNKLEKYFKDEWKMLQQWTQKGEIFLGHTSSGFLVVHGFGPGFRWEEY